MKAKILVLGLVLATVATVVIYPSLRSDATGVAAQPPPRLTPIGTNKVEVVFVLDTTGSMGGLIEAAKEKIWSIATTLSQAHPAPEIRMGLVAYRDRGDAYVTQRRRSVQGPRLDVRDADAASAPTAAATAPRASTRRSTTPFRKCPGAPTRALTKSCSWSAMHRRTWTIRTT